MVICLKRGADLHKVQLMPLPLTVSCFSKIQIAFTFLVPAHPGSPRQRAIKCVCVCVCYNHNPCTHNKIKAEGEVVQKLRVETDEQRPILLPSSPTWSIKIDADRQTNEKKEMHKHQAFYYLLLRECIRYSKMII